MRRQISSAAIKRQRAPAAAERWNASVSVLQVEQPINAGTGSGASWIVSATERAQRQERARRVVRVRNSPGQVCPGPTAGRGVGVGMLVLELLSQKPIANPL